MLAPVYALVSSVGWGTSDYFGGLRSRTLGVLRTLFVSQLVSIAVLVVVVAAVGGRPPGAVVLPAVLAGVAEAVGISSLYRGLSTGAAGLVAPASAASPVVAVVVSVVMGELPRILEAVGLVLILGGLIVASREPDTGAARRFDLRSLGYGLVSALGFGAYFVFTHDASGHSVPWALLIARCTAVTMVGLAVLATRTRPTMTRTQFGQVAIVGLLVVIGDGSYAIASTLGALTLVAVLSATHPVVTILWARFHSHEHLSRLRVGGIAVTLLGVIAVTTA